MLKVKCLKCPAKCTANCVVRWMILAAIGSKSANRRHEYEGPQDFLE